MKADVCHQPTQTAHLANARCSFGKNVCDSFITHRGHPILFSSQCNRHLGRLWSHIWESVFKKITIYGYKLHLLVTVGGVILDFELAPANQRDLVVGYELLENHTDKDVFGDKAYISAEIKRMLQDFNRIQLIILPRSNQKVQVSQSVCHFVNSVRQIIETLNGQLTKQFNIK